MKHILTLVFTLFTLLNSSYSQIYIEKKWDHTYGGNDFEVLTSLKQTSDGGFILGGHSKSAIGFEVSDSSRGGNDFWIVKTDSAGIFQWDAKFGGNYEDKLFSLDQTSDGGFILGGFTTSDSSGDVSQSPKGGMDFWLVKTDSAGNKLWDKRYGGSDYDWLYAVQETSDGGIIMGGLTYSDSSGDVSHPSLGSDDFWIIKTDASGNKLWDNRFGGNNQDQLYDLKQTPDGGFILGGRTSSDSIFDVTHPPRGDNDYWIVKTDANGNKMWDSRFGGTGKDNFLHLETTSDSGFILGGFTRSNMGADVSEPTRDTSALTNVDRGDAWIVKVDSTGAKQWDKRFGGHWVEDAFGYVSQTSDGGYIMGCATYSNISGDKTENNFGYEQMWLIKTDSAGTKIWDKTIFSNGEDEYAYPIQLADGCFAVACWSYADSAAYKTENGRGNYDYWLLKLCETTQPQLPIANFTISAPALCAGGCFDFENTSYDAGSFQWLFPGATPSSSTKGFPTFICYPDTGHFDVTLIATNASGSDTIIKTGIVIVNPLPLVNITQLGDTLFAPQGFVHYQWWEGNLPLPVDTNYFYVFTNDGFYHVDVLDSVGCPNSDTIYASHVGINEFTSNGISIFVYPNPVVNELKISGLQPFKNGNMRIIDLLGNVIYQARISAEEQIVNLCNFVPGIYFIEVDNNNIKSFARFVKE